MTFLLIQKDARHRLMADGCVVPADQVPMLRDAAALLVAATRIHAAAAQEVASAVAAAQAAAHAEGLADGRAEAEAQVGARLFQLELAAAEQRTAARARIADMALAVVRRIAGEVGDSAMVAGIAERAVAELEPDSRAVIRVPTHAIERTRAVVPAPFEVEADSTLGPGDCVVETRLGRTLAGLDTQLAMIARLWAGTEAEEAGDHAG